MQDNNNHNSTDAGLWPTLRAHADAADRAGLVFVSVRVDDRYVDLSAEAFNLGVEAVCESARARPRSSAIVDADEPAAKRYFVGFGGADPARRFERYVNEQRPLPFRSANIELDGTAPGGLGH